MPRITIPKKLQPLLRPKQFKFVYGGRGSAKSMTIADILLMRVETERLRVCGMRELMNSIDDSVHSLFSSEIQRLDLGGFSVYETKIRHSDGGSIGYKGLSRNPSAVKSMHDFDVFWVEEGSGLSKRSIDLLLPTLRKAGAELWISLNPEASEDPSSKEFIAPFKDKLVNGFYEDDLHMVIKVNYNDNPFFPDNLEMLRQKHFREKDRAEYDHIWNGEFNDSVESALIKAEWFDACIDAHVKLGFSAVGQKMAAHDPSDQGGDSKGFAYRHGSVVLDVQEKLSGDVNEGCDWATGLAINYGVDAYTWDCDGLGAGLNRQTSKAFDGKLAVISQFKGSESVDNPDMIFDHVEGSVIQEQKTNKQALKNKRAQYYYELRKRVIRTHEAINGAYHDPDTLISFDSSISLLSKLRSELCRIPVKPNANGLFQLYTKEEMKNKFKIESPNLGDSVMMLMRQPHKAINNFKMPQSIRPMGRK